MIPTLAPSGYPSSGPTSIPSNRPITIPSCGPTATPSFEPTKIPTVVLSALPTGTPSTLSPSSSRTPASLAPFQSVIPISATPTKSTIPPVTTVPSSIPMQLLASPTAKPLISSCAPSLSPSYTPSFLSSQYPPHRQESQASFTVTELFKYAYISQFLDPLAVRVLNSTFQNITNGVTGGRILQISIVQVEQLTASARHSLELQAATVKVKYNVSYTFAGSLSSYYSKVVQQLQSSVASKSFNKVFRRYTITYGSSLTGAVADSILNISQPIYTYGAPSMSPVLVLYQTSSAVTNTQPFTVAVATLGSILAVALLLVLAWILYQRSLPAELPATDANAASGNDRQKQPFYDFFKSKVLNTLVKPKKVEPSGDPDVFGFEVLGKDGNEQSEENNPMYVKSEDSSIDQVVPSKVNEDGVETSRLAEQIQIKRIEAETERIRVEAEVVRMAEELELKKKMMDSEAQRLDEKIRLKKQAVDAEIIQLREQLNSKRIFEETESKRLAEATSKLIFDQIEAKKRDEEAKAKKIVEDAEAKRFEMMAEIKRLTDTAEAKKAAVETEVRRITDELFSKRMANRPALFPGTSYSPSPGHYTGSSSSYSAAPALSSAHDIKRQTEENYEKKRLAYEKAYERRRLEEQDKRRRDEEALLRQQAEEQRARKLEEEAIEARRLQEHRIEEEAFARRHAEQMYARRIAEDEARRQTEARRQAEEAYARRQAEVAHAMRLAEEEARAQEAKRLKDEADARKRAFEEAEEKIKLFQESEIKRKAQESDGKRGIFPSGKLLLLSFSYYVIVSFFLMCSVYIRLNKPTTSCFARFFGYLINIW